MNQIKYFEKNTKGKDYFVTDIHGYFKDLKIELKRIGFNPKVDRLFCGGDLCDRGPECPSVLDWLKEPWFHSVHGNHECFVFDYNEAEGHAKEHIQGMHCGHGGRWYYNLSKTVQANIYQAFKALPIMMEVKTDNGTVGILHAEASFNDWNITKQLILNNDNYANNKALWSKSKLKNKDTSCIENIGRMYVGHKEVRRQTLLGNVMYCDTGAGKGGFVSVFPLI